MPKQNKQRKTCQKCQQEFDCQVTNIDACFCSKIYLDDTTIEKLKSFEYDCLCEECLRVFNSEFRM